MATKLFNMFYPDVPDDSFEAAELRMQELEKNLTVASILPVPANCSTANGQLKSYSESGGITESDVTQVAH